jgi:competence protein ComEC
MGVVAERSPRVAVAPLVPLSLAWAAGIVADRYGHFWGASTWGALALGASAGLGAGLWRRPMAGTLTLLAIAAALGGGWHHVRWSGLDPADLARVVAETPRPVWVRGVLGDVLGVRPGDPALTRAVLDVSAVQDGGCWRSASGRALLTIVGPRDDLVAGEAVEAAGTLARVAGPLNPGEFDARAYLRAQGVRLYLVVDNPQGVWRRSVDDRECGSLTMTGARLLGGLRAWSRARLVEGLGPRSAPLASALLLGHREEVDPGVNDAFARTGTTHLLAISGLHLQALAMVLLSLFRALRFGRRRALAAVALATVAYALLVGLAPSVVRSSAMTVTACLAGLIDRTARPANALALAALVTMGLNPAHLFDVGCQLSFLAIAAIVWGSAPLWACWSAPADPLDRLEQRYAPRWRRVVRGAGRWLLQMLLVSMVVWLVTLPLLALRFHLAAPIGVLLNLPLIPLTTLALLSSGLTLALSALWSPLALPTARLTDSLLTLTDALVRWGASLRWGHVFVPSPPWAWVLGVYALLGLATAAQMGRWPRPSRRVAWGLLAAWVVVGLGLGLGPARPSRPRGVLDAEVLAVGHGLAVLLTTGDGHTWVYDCGRMRAPEVGRRVIAPALWARGVQHIDAIILSHADADHYNGLPDLLDRFSIGAVRVPPGFADASNPGAIHLIGAVRARGIPVRPISDGDHWESAGARFHVRHPPPAGASPAGPSSDNSRSVVLDVEAYGRHVLLTGDLEADGLSRLVRRPAPPLAGLLAPHHGGRTANPPWLYDWARPGSVIVSQRPPLPGTTDALAALPFPVLRTWERGAIRLTWTPGGVIPRGFRDDQPAWDE